MEVSAAQKSSRDSRNHFRFHGPHAHLAPESGDGWSGAKAESFARFFGTLTFLIGQTIGPCIEEVTNDIHRRVVTS